ncbi:MAG: cytochrome c biogenesis CcdA family protein [Planctomycetota bacterium]|jgi:cytochrome c-type biogenesis protein
MKELFESLSHAVEQTSLVAVGAAFAWGVLSLVLSPCHLASIPLIVGYVSGQGPDVTTRRAFALSSVFALGILLTIGGIGAVTAGAGRMLGDVGPYVNYVLAAVFIVVGLYLLGVISLPWSGPGQVGVKGRGLLPAFVLGLIFGIALGPCTFAYMAPMLAVVFKLASTRLGYGVLLLVVFAVGHCSMIVLAGTCTELVQRYLHWTDRSRGTTILRAVCGVLVILGGLYMIYVAP